MAFSTEWLALREPADHAARNANVLAAACGLAGASPVVLDIGCGTGSTLRAMGERLGPDAEWRLVDSDRALLAQAAEKATGPVETHEIDIDDISALPLDGVTLVTASALLDLVSRDWVARLAAELAARGLPFYGALSYDGIMYWDPSLPADREVIRAFNRHQTGEKGFGRALGPVATAATTEAFREAGYGVETGESAWRLGPEDTNLQRALLSGIVEAATESGAGKAGPWGAARAEAIETAQCHVGHTDIVAWPSGTV